MLVLLSKGDQVPEIPFKEVVGRAKVLPLQIGGIVLKIGVSGEFIIISKLSEIELQEEFRRLLALSANLTL